MAEHRYGPTSAGHIDIRLIGDPDDVNTAAARLPALGEVVEDSGLKHLRSQEGMTRRYLRAHLTTQDADA